MRYRPYNRGTQFPIPICLKNVCISLVPDSALCSADPRVPPYDYCRFTVSCEIGWCGTQLCYFLFKTVLHFLHLLYFHICFKMFVKFYGKACWDFDWCC